MDKVSSFFVGNVVGITILVAGVMITAPTKMKETEAIQKNARRDEAQAAKAKDVEQSSKLQSALDQAPKSPGVVIAGKEISRGEQITKDHLGIDPNARPEKYNFTDTNQLVGKTARMDIHKGSVITPATIGDQPILKSIFAGAEKPRRED